MLRLSQSLKRPARDQMIVVIEDNTVIMEEGDNSSISAAAKKEDSSSLMLYNKWTTAYNDKSKINECMMMDTFTNEDMNKLINSYMKANNPSPYTDSYYPQYHVVDFVVFNVKANKAFESIKAYLTYNRMLEAKCTRNYGYRLTKRRDCVNSYSTIIELIFTYPRRLT